MEVDTQNLLLEGAKEFGVALNPEMMKAFDIFLRELMKWNRRINLTAIRSEGGVIVKHFLDSISVFPYVPNSSMLLDIGSGAGFPGIPLKIVDPSLEVTSVDSSQKKVDFQRHLIRTIGLAGIKVIHARIEHEEIILQMAGRFDRVVSRALSDLSTFLRMSKPFLKRGGIAIAMKGRLKPEEIRSLHGGGVAGFRPIRMIPFLLPFSSDKRTVLLFENP